MAVNSELDIELIQLLDQTMREFNIFAQTYEMMGEEFKKQNNSHLQEELHLLFSIKPGVDKSRYNFQVENEVAAIFSTTADGEMSDSYVVVRNKATKELQTVSSMDPNVEPWIYPIFYPYGTQGWHRNMFREDGKRISRLCYLKNLIALRDHFNPFIRGRRLFQQFVVDFYVKIEKDRIEYCRSHQTELHIASYNNIKEYLNRRVHNNENMRLGKIQILPSTFVGSPRYMLQCYHDAMVQVQKKGKPDLFITMTCNPQWREIQENLLPHQQASDRPDLCTRVFHLEKKELIDTIVKKKFFGEVAAFI